MRSANAAFWSAIASALREEGVADVPDALDPDRASVPDRIGADVLFTQTCGYPLQTIYRGQYQILGVPSYDAPGCDAPEIAGPSHCAFVVVREDDPAQTVADLRGRVFACNSRHSNSGMNLPRRSIAPLTGGKPFFARVVETGGHAPSMQAVREGRADAASIDNMTFVFHADYRPAAIVGLRVLARTVPSPAIPFVTSHETDPATVAALRRALAAVMENPNYGETRRALRLLAIAAPEPSDYALLLRYEREAAELGYPELA